MTTQAKRRRIMRELRVDEISAVDRPAQTHARMALMKRADDADSSQEYDEMQKIVRDERPRSFDSFEQATAYLREAHGMSKSDAMSAAAREHGDLLEKYQHEGDERVSKALERMRSPSLPPAVGEFNALVDRIARRDMCDRVTAMRRARAEDPELFGRFQAV